MTRPLPKTPEYRNVDLAMFRNEIVPRYRPAVLRGAVTHWPSVREGAGREDAICGYLMRFDQGRIVKAFVGDASIKGRYFYNDDMRGVNYVQRDMPFSEAVKQLVSFVGNPEPPSLYVGSTPIPDCLPTLMRELPLELVDPSVIPRLWIGNATTVSTHYDLSDNIACVVKGRRRFTFFPPDQVANLYVGPLEFTLAGQPCSMVALRDPDFERYPRFAQALETAEEAELEPGDAVYIPYLWWHHVESLDPINMLVNYWWNDAQSGDPAAFECLIHAILTVRSMPPERRAMWRTIFDHYIFETGGNPVEHLAPRARGILNPLSPKLAQFIRNWLKGAINRS